MARIRGEASAEMQAGLLRANGIPCSVALAPNSLPLYGSAALADHVILVRRTDVERAAQLLTTARSQPAEASQRRVPRIELILFALMALTAVVALLPQLLTR